MDSKQKKTEFIGIRLTPEVKNELDIILNILNENRQPNEPKYNYIYAITFLIDYYKNHPNFKLHIKEQRLIKKQEDLKQARELNEMQLNKIDNDLKEVRNQLNNKSLDSYKHDQQIILTEPLKNAMKIIKDNCKQRGITEFNNIPNEMFYSVSNTFKIDRHKLQQAIKENFDSWNL